MARTVVGALALLAVLGGCGKAERGPEGAAGPPGPPGPAGEAGPKGQSGVGYARTVVVSPGDSPSAGGEALRLALAGIADASINSPWLLHLEPGVYALGAQGLAMRPYVHIEGSGQDVTFVRSSAPGATVTGADYAELRALTVEHTGGQAEAVALANGSGQFRVRHVTVHAAEGRNSTVGLRLSGPLDAAVFEGVRVLAASSDGNNVGVECSPCTARLLDVEAQAVGGASATGIRVQAGSLEVRGGSVLGRGARVDNVGVEAVSGGTVTLVRVDARGDGGQNGVGLRLNMSTGVLREGLVAGTGDARQVGLDVVGLGAGPVQVQRSIVSGATSTVVGQNATVRIADSQLAGGAVSATGGDLRCFGAYDEDYANASGPTVCP